ncbi:MAG: dihydroorotase [Desulfofustis sp.]|nr:dihydroorotase [Desulfofustis sp.]
MDITLESPLDMHLHLREGDMLDLTVPLTADHFAGAVIMPNLVAPVDSLNNLRKYRQAIESYCHGKNFRPYMTLFFKNYSRQELEECREHILGIKLYPAGITTQSEAGVSDFSTIEKTLEDMQELNIPLLVHGESNGFVLDREREFLEVYRSLASRFPDLHIIMEHITTADTVQLLDEFDNLSATVTLHHLMITLDDVVGDLLRPDLFCKPVAKTPRDREALRQAVFSGHPKLMFGSDSAPHPRHKKECIGCAAGVFSAPVALPLLAQIFEDEGCLELLQGFVSANACRRYDISPPAKQVLLTQSPWQVPHYYKNVSPFFAGQTLRWSINSSFS